MNVTSLTKRIAHYIISNTKDDVICVQEHKLNKRSIRSEQSLFISKKIIFSLEQNRYMKFRAFLKMSVRMAGKCSEFTDAVL